MVTTTIESYPTAESSPIADFSPTVDPSPTTPALPSPEATLTAAGSPAIETIQANVAGDNPGLSAPDAVTFVDRLHGWTVAGSCQDGACGVFATSDGGLIWTLIPWNVRSIDISVDSGPGIPSGLRFVSREVGWIPIGGGNGGAGGIARTSDGGKTWERQGAQDGWTMDAVSVVSTSDVWAIGGRRFPLAGGPFLLHSQDAGVSWSQVLPRLAPTDGIDFVDAQHGFGIGDGLRPDVILASGDGSSWSTIATIPNAVLQGLSFVDRNHGWVIGRGGSDPLRSQHLYQTVDGGKSWRLVYATGQDLGSVRFFNASDGILVARSPGPAILSTSDGGATWAQVTPLTIPNATAFAYSFTDRMTGWAVALSGLDRLQILSTTDGGAIWTTVIVDLPTKFASTIGISAISGSQVWIGVNNRILTTADGGQSWIDLVLPSNVIIVALSFVDANTGWLMANDGRILRTVDGGENWK